MSSPEPICPECGGVPFSGASLLYEHHDITCSFRWNGKEFVPAKEESNA